MTFLFRKHRYKLGLFIFAYVDNIRADILVIPTLKRALLDISCRFTTRQICRTQPLMYIHAASNVRGSDLNNACIFVLFSYLLNNNNAHMHKHSMHVPAVFSFIGKSIKHVDSVQHTTCLMFASHIVENLSMRIFYSFLKLGSVTHTCTYNALVFSCETYTAIDNRDISSGFILIHSLWFFSGAYYSENAVTSVCSIEQFCQIVNFTSAFFNDQCTKKYGI